MAELRLRQEEAKLLYLAVAYHLGRPGSELDPATKQPVEHGLAEVARDLQPQLRLATASIELRDGQIARLGSGMLGSITELKAYPMLELRAVGEGGESGGPRSTVPGFDATLRHLYPAVEEDVDAAVELAAHMLALKRRLDAALAGAADAAAAAEVSEPEEPRKRRWWPFRR